MGHAASRNGHRDALELLCDVKSVCATLNRDMPREKKHHGHHEKSTSPYKNLRRHSYESVSTYDSQDLLH